jgi:hypothetical protein
LADASAPELRKEYQAVYNKATFAKETANNKRKAAATKMIHFYANLLSLDFDCQVLVEQDSPGADGG